MVKSKLLFSLVFLLILSVSFSACLSNYSYSFNARVLDAKFRPVPNALVTITYDSGFAAGEQYFTSEPRLTSSDGSIQFFINNPGQAVNRDFDCRIILEARVFGGSKNQRTGLGFIYQSSLCFTVNLFILLSNSRFELLFLCIINPL